MHTCTTPLPIVDPESKKIGFVAPITVTLRMTGDPPNTIELERF